MSTLHQKLTALATVLSLSVAHVPAMAQGAASDPAREPSSSPVTSRFAPTVQFLRDTSRQFFNFVSPANVASNLGWLVQQGLVHGVATQALRSLPRDNLLYRPYRDNVLRFADHFNRTLATHNLRALTDEVTTPQGRTFLATLTGLGAVYGVGNWIVPGYALNVPMLGRLSMSGAGKALTSLPILNLVADIATRNISGADLTASQFALNSLAVGAHQAALQLPSVALRAYYWRARYFRPAGAPGVVDGPLSLWNARSLEDFAETMSMLGGAVSVPPLNLAGLLAYTPASAAPAASGMGHPVEGGAAVTLAPTSAPTPAVKLVPTSVPTPAPTPPMVAGGGGGSAEEVVAVVAPAPTPPMVAGGGGSAAAAGAMAYRPALVQPDVSMQTLAEFVHSRLLGRDGEVSQAFLRRYEAISSAMEAEAREPYSLLFQTEDEIRRTYDEVRLREKLESMFSKVYVNSYFGERPHPFYWICRNNQMQSLSYSQMMALLYFNHLSEPFVGSALFRDLPDAVRRIFQ
jgi:hypothetical protein